MLVLSRRSGETIHLPTVDAVLEVLQINSNNVRIGVKAPQSLPVLRGELVKEGQCFPALRPVDVAALREEKHALRNLLNTVSIGLSLAKKHLEDGNQDHAANSIEHALGCLGSISPKPKQQPKPSAIKALVVDDDKNEQTLLASYLKSSGIDVDTAEDGQEAIEYLEDGRSPNIILMDMNMPRCDGPTAIHKIRMRPESADIKIFAVSGAAKDEFQLDGKVDQWFLKPLDPEKLVGSIAREILSHC